METFTNQFGEHWWFMYDTNEDIGILQGDDDLIKGQTFYVIDGKCPMLILNKEEKDWLKSVWDKYSKPLPKDI